MNKDVPESYANGIPVYDIIVKDYSHTKKIKLLRYDLAAMESKFINGNDNEVLSYYKTTIIETCSINSNKEIICKEDSFFYKQKEMFFKALDQFSINYKASDKKIGDQQNRDRIDLMSKLLERTQKNKIYLTDDITHLYDECTYWPPTEFEPIIFVCDINNLNYSYSDYLQDDSGFVYRVPKKCSREIKNDIDKNSLSFQQATLNRKYPISLDTNIPIANIKRVYVLKDN